MKTADHPCDGYMLSFKVLLSTLLKDTRIQLSVHSKYHSILNARQDMICGSLETLYAVANIKITAQLTLCHLWYGYFD